MRFIYVTLLISLMSHLVLAAPAQPTPQTTVKFKKAQAVRPEVEIYKAASFDAEVLDYINPGKFYYISNKIYGPFYKIKVSDKVIGYVADTEINIEGVGTVEEKPFVDDPDPAQVGKKKKKEDILPEVEEEEEEEANFKSSYNGIFLSLINYHETTMGGMQVADLYAIGYRYIPFISDYAASVSWDINAAYGAPAYYKDKLDADTKGLTVWTGAQIINVSIYDNNKTLRYGVGGFVKYSNYGIESHVTGKNYSLQELTVGVSLEGGFIFHFNPVSFDLGLRYYWERESYGGLSLGFLF